MGFLGLGVYGLGFQVSLAVLAGLMKGFFIRLIYEVRHKVGFR